MRPLRPLLPSAKRPLNEPLPPIPRDRVASACDQCRARKIKCNGDRPKCLECVKRSTTCHYATRSAETQGQALKRKYDALQAENEAYTELFQLIKTRPDHESHEILRRIKMGTTVKDVLRRIQEADLLMQLNNPSTTSSSNTSTKQDTNKYRYTLPLISGMPAHLLNPEPVCYSSAFSVAAAAGHGTGAEAADC